MSPGKIWHFAMEMGLVGALWIAHSKPLLISLLEFENLKFTTKTKNHKSNKQKKRNFSIIRTKLQTTTHKLDQTIGTRITKNYKSNSNHLIYQNSFQNPDFASIEAIAKTGAFIHVKYKINNYGIHIPTREREMETSKTLKVKANQKLQCDESRLFYT